MADNNENQQIKNENKFRRTDSDKANQIASSSPYERSSSHPQADASASSADNDMDRQITMDHNLKKDADEAQSDGDLSFPEGK